MTLTHGDRHPAISRARRLGRPRRTSICIMVIMHDQSIPLILSISLVLSLSVLLLVVVIVIIIKLYDHMINPSTRAPTKTSMQAILLTSGGGMDETFAGCYTYVCVYIIYIYIYMYVYIYIYILLYICYVVLLLVLPIYRFICDVCYILLLLLLPHAITTIVTTIYYYQHYDFDVCSNRRQGAQRPGSTHRLENL